ncbi:hypothetical protein FHX72_000535 [Pseudoclavibacter helvolus]|uniref:Uncharacterized protein n=1 Tax=Pseudoclavibacter helvolus TaxID=255205 RepID=A0A7W4UL56_9MICO|nr:hypothetical protein [Pseudoclavibacter helvolus]
MSAITAPLGPLSLDPLSLDGFPLNPSSVEELLLSPCLGRSFR